MRILAAFLPALFASVALGDDAAPPRYLVRFDDTVRNESAVTLRDVMCEAPLPVSGPGQTVHWLRLSAHDWKIDDHVAGRRIAQATVPTLAPGEAITFAWLASVEFSDRGHDTAPCAVPRPSEAGDDAPILALDSAEVRQAADAVRAAAASDTNEALAIAALRHVRRTVRYELDGGWRSASDVLRCGSGSCSESAFAFVAICRRLGVPARTVGGSLLRTTTPGRAVDATFHRIAEVWLPDHGWLPLETTGDAAPTDDDAWVSSAAPDRMLVLTRGPDAAAPAGLYYHARNTWFAPKGAPRPVARAAKRAYWVLDAHALEAEDDPLAGLPDGRRPSFARCEALLADVDGLRAARPVAVDPDAVLALLLAAGHPGALRLAVRRACGGGAACERVRALVAAHCGPDLAAEFLPLLGGGAARFEAWWADASREVGPDEPGHLVRDSTTR